MTHIRLAIILSLFLVVSCEKETTDPATGGLNELEEIVVNSDWIITKFIDSGKDESYHFRNYHFKFEGTGAIIATGNNSVFQGSWNIDHGHSNDDNPSDMDFNIFFDLTNAFEELNDDWEVININDQKIELIDISGGNGGIDYLTFTKR